MPGKLAMSRWVGHLQEPYYFDFGGILASEGAAPRLHGDSDSFDPRATDAAAAVFLAEEGYAFNSAAIAALVGERAGDPATAFGAPPMDDSALADVVAFDLGAGDTIFDGPLHNAEPGFWHSAGWRAESGTDVPTQPDGELAPDFDSGSLLLLDQLVPTYFAGDLIP